MAAGPWGGHSNGYIPVELLTELSWASGQHLHKNAARDLEALNVAYRARFGADISVTDSYRDFAAQVSVKAKKPKLAATPGKSNHGWALAVDLGGGINTFGSGPYDWMKANAPAYRWIHPAWAEPNGSKPEAWHWEYDGSLDSTTPTNPTNPQEDTMTPEQASQLADIFNRVRSLGGTNPQQALVYGDNFQVIASRIEKVPELYDRVRGDDPAGDMLQMLRQQIINLDAKVTEALAR